MIIFLFLSSAISHHQKTYQYRDVTSIFSDSFYSCTLRSTFSIKDYLPFCSFFIRYRGTRGGGAPSRVAGNSTRTSVTPTTQSKYCNSLSFVCVAKLMTTSGCHCAQASGVTEKQTARRRIYITRAELRSHYELDIGTYVSSCH